MTTSPANIPTGSPAGAPAEPGEETPPQTNPTPQQLAEAVDRARELLSPLDADIRERAEKLVKARDAFLASGVREMVRRLKADERSKPVLFELVDDPVIYAVLLELGIVRPDVTTRVARAMERVKPYVKSHGGDIELVRVEDTPEGKTAFVRLHGSCSGCSMSAETLRDGVQESITSIVPEVTRVEEVKDGPVAGVVQLTIGSSDDTHGWVEGPEPDAVTADAPYRFRTDEHDILIIRQEDRLFAYRNECPHQGLPMHDGEIVGDTITCPYHGFCFDTGSGECHTEPQVQLEPFPLRIEGGKVWVRPAGGDA